MKGIFEQVVCLKPECQMKQPRSLGSSKSLCTLRPESLVSQAAGPEERAPRCCPLFAAPSTT